MQRRVAVIACTLSVGMTLASPDAAADAGRLRVDRAPSALDCPDAELLARLVNARTQRESLSAAGAAGTIVVDFSFAAGTYRAGVRASGGQTGERSMSEAATSCAGVAHAVELALALMLDETPRPAEPAPPSGEEVARPPVAPTGASHQAREIFVEVGASAGMSAGLLPSFAPGLSADVDAVSARRWSLGLGALWVPYEAFDLSPGSIEITLAAAHVDACAGLVDAGPRIRLEGCVTPHVGAIHGRSLGFAATGSATRLWVAAGMGGVLRGRIVGPLGWRARLEGLVPLTRAQFSIDQVGVSPSPFVIGGRVELGPTVTF